MCPQAPGRRSRPPCGAMAQGYHAADSAGFGTEVMPGVYVAGKGNLGSPAAAAAVPADVDPTAVVAECTRWPAGPQRRCFGVHQCPPQPMWQ